MRGGATCFDGQHAAREEFDDTDEGVCFNCGLTIRWEVQNEKVGHGWYEDDTLVILVLTPEEVKAAQDNLGRDAWGPLEELESLRRKLNIEPPADWNPESARADLRSE
jgi:hypothetical protein